MTRVLTIYWSRSVGGSRLVPWIGTTRSTGIHRLSQKPLSSGVPISVLAVLKVLRSIAHSGGSGVRSCLLPLAGMTAIRGLKSHPGEDAGPPPKLTTHDAHDTANLSADPPNCPTRPAGASSKHRPPEVYPRAIARAGVMRASPIRRKHAADPLQIYLTWANNAKGRMPGRYLRYPPILSG